jgi:hypothetical protein
VERRQVAAGCGDFVDEPDVPEVDDELEDESLEPEVDVDEDESPDDDEAPSVVGLRLSVR